ncbi:MAG: 1-deoxy-D-xylulose-5-phosphate synthase [Synergistaceae bacterium]|nr:1-deoxy-D-xylulose-5-phosphate synthase [Synergistaceae bacterium]
MEFLKPGFTREDLLRIDEKFLPLLADEVRAVIIDTVKQNGGHLGSSLGVVELTIAMLRTFDPFNDRIIFDVGHQSYPYKILTDRFDQFHTLRLKDGISGFPRRSESPCDHFNTGHSSTSISAALGMAKARDLLHEKRNVIAFIGDASLINGLAFEALNYVQETHTNFIIILNDNRHSISNRVGGFSTMLARLSANTFYRRVKNKLRRILGVEGSKYLEKVRDFIKFLVKPNNIFDELGINYWGPFDGHDIKNAEKMLELAKNYYRPVLLHFNTIKGKGLAEAEADPTKYHQVSPANEVKSRTWSEAASKIAEELAMKDERIVCFTAAMVTGVKLEKFARAFPARFFDVGIAESHMLTMAAGLAAGGMRPWVFIYSTFLQRAMDQLVHDIALQNLPVVIMVDRAGLAGSDGDTHQGLLDISWGRAIPNLEIYTPCDEFSLKDAMLKASTRDGPTLIRYPRGKIPENNFAAVSDDIVKLADGEKWALLGNGASVSTMLDVKNLAENITLDTECEEKTTAHDDTMPEKNFADNDDAITPRKIAGIDAEREKIHNDTTTEHEKFYSPAVYDVRKIKPLNLDIIDEILRSYELVAVLEENYMPGGLGEAVASRIAEKNYPVRLLSFGVPDVCVKHATQTEQRELYGLTPENVIAQCKKFLVKSEAQG